MATDEDYYSQQPRPEPARVYDKTTKCATMAGRAVFWSVEGAIP